MPYRDDQTFSGRFSIRGILLPAFAVCLIAFFLLSTTHTASAQTTIDWDDIECGGGAWAGPGVGPAGPSTQQFTDIGCTGVNMSVSYSGNMWDNNSTPNLYGGAAPVTQLQDSLRWTNNRLDTGGQAGTATGPSTVTILFDQPVFVNQFVIASLSRLLNNNTGTLVTYRYEWVDVRAYGESNDLLVANSVTPATYEPDGTSVVRPGSPLIQHNGSGIYRVRGTSLQGTCNDCGYDYATFSYTSTPVQRIELIHFVTEGTEFTDPRSDRLTSVALDSMIIRVPDETARDWGDAPDIYGTLAAAGGPNHLISGAIYLGAVEDSEADGQPNTNANGDDITNLDDEDSVPASDLVLTEGSTALVRVTVTNQTNSSAFLYGWIDFDGNGTFDNDESATLTVPAGTSQQQVQLDFGAVPEGGPSTSYARFRISTDDAVSSPTGAADDGEVEDYRVSFTAADQFDWGDAPDTGAGAGTGNYNTLDSDNGPSHTIVNDLSIGDVIDFEPDGIPNVGANGDDVTGVDDEDGVTIPALVENTAASVTVRVTNLTGSTARLYGWIDFNGDGVFETSERATVDVPTGANGVDVNLNFGLVPANGVTQTYARFRLSSDTAAAAPTGPAQGGEVEDYVVTISPAPLETLDWGDAPDTGVGTDEGNYNTLANDNGPRHVIVDTLRMGLRVDSETDGQPTTNADGDDLNPPTALDDEDGVNPLDLTLVEGEASVVRVTATNQTEASAILYGWIDFDGDGTFESGERAVAAVPAGSVNTVFNLNFGTVPTTGVTSTYARFRLSTDAAAGEPVGPADDGEVEDYQVAIGALIDWGDAPDGAIGTGTGNYNTLASDNGPSHRVVSDLTIGAVLDGETDGQPNISATGDDTNPVGAADDEDGVLVSGLSLIEGDPAQISVVVNNETQDAAVLYGWIDFNANGNFEPTESAQVVVPAGTVLTPVSLDFGAVPANGVTQTYARFRLSTDTAAASPVGPATNGEVEDYEVSITGTPAAIDLVAFAAEPAAGAVIVRWETAGEVDTNGFHLYRATTGAREDAVRVTSAMIPAKGPNGGEYEYTDTAVVAGVTYFYWLIEVENNAEAAEYGPVQGGALGSDTQQHEVFLPVVVRQ